MIYQLTVIFDTHSSFYRSGIACLTADKLRRRLSLLSILHLNSQSIQELGSIHSAAVIGVVPKKATEFVLRI